MWKGHLAFWVGHFNISDAINFNDVIKIFKLQVIFRKFVAT